MAVTAISLVFIKKNNEIQKHNLDTLNFVTYSNFGLQSHFVKIIAVVTSELYNTTTTTQKSCKSVSLSLTTEMPNSRQDFKIRPYKLPLKNSPACQLQQPSQALIHKPVNNYTPTTTKSYWKLLPPSTTLWSAAHFNLQVLRNSQVQCMTCSGFTLTYHKLFLQVELSNIFTDSLVLPRQPTGNSVNLCSIYDLIQPTS